MTLEELGFTKEELQERVVDRLCTQVLHGVTWDEDGNEIETNSQFSRKLNERVAKHIDDTIAKIAEKHVLPNVAEFIENLCLQETTKWGEKKGEPVTFIEYLVQRADAYMREDVDHNGKTQKEDSYSWRTHSTRIAYMVDKHLQYSIESAMKQALETANASIAGGLEKAVKTSLNEVISGLKVTVKAK